MKIFSGSSNKPLAEKIAANLGLGLSPVEIFVFPDGERRIKLNEKVVNEDTIVVQSTATPVDNSYTELFFIIDALRRSGAKSVTVVMPYVGYQRQDHIFREGEAVSLRVMINILESLGVDRIITLDLHSIKIPEFFKIPQTELSALSMFAKEIRDIVNSKSEAQNSDLSVIKNSVLVSPDMGGLRRIKIISTLLNMPWIATVKDRDLDTGEIEIGRLDGVLPEGARAAFIVDDMISSGKTIVKAANLLRENGLEEIYVFVTHPIFSADASELLQKSDIQKVFVTDSVFVPEEKLFEKLEILSVAEIISKELGIRN